MAKRFTDNNKWSKPWFRRLEPRMKLLWLYVLDNCDVAGVWHVDVEHACFCIGEQMSHDEAYEALQKQIEVLEDGHKWFVLDFIKYQYGRLSRDCRPHLPVIQALESHGIDINSVNQAEQHKYGSVTDKRRKEIFERDRNICCYCGDEFADEDLDPDHVIPKSRGGNDSKGNLVAACKPCNSDKSDSHPEAYIGSMDDAAAVLDRMKRRIAKNLFNTLFERLLNSLEDKDKEKEKEKDMDSGGSVRGESAPRPDAVPDVLDTPEFLAAWSDWHRSLRKRGMSRWNADSRREQLALLAKVGPDTAIDAIRRSIANAYKGIVIDGKQAADGSSKGKRGAENIKRLSRGNDA